MDERQVNEGKVRAGVALMLEGLGYTGWEDDPHLKDTPERVARAWCTELAPDTGPPEVTMFPGKENTGQMVILRGIPVRSMCAHHMLPIIGTATVAYISGGTKGVIGLSKLSRIVDYFARGLTVQESLTDNIADFLYKKIEDADGRSGCGVLIAADHHCMKVRGVKHDGDMVTSALRGNFFESSVRAEFLDLARRRSDHG